MLFHLNAPYLEYNNFLKIAIKISYTTYTSIVYMLSSEPKKIFSFGVPQETIDELNLIAKIYTFEKLEKEYTIGF